jgi:aromatic-L-amino-acid decarboxylase
MTTYPPAGPHDLPQLLADFGRWISDYWQSLPERPVLSRATPGDVLGKLPQHPPELPGGDTLWQDIRADLDSIVVPGLTHWQHPSFYAYFPANISVPAILGDVVSAGLGVQGMLWLTSPACTELETRVLDWLRELLGLPVCFDSRPEVSGVPWGGGVIQGTASEATLSAMVAGRDRVRRERQGAGVAGRAEFVVYASGQSHSSIAKAAMIAGIADGANDDRHIRLIDVDDELAMKPGALGEAMRADLSAGLTPCFVCVNVGTTATTAMDRIDQIAAEVDGLPAGTPRPWVHVDAAHAGAAAVCPEHRGMLRGLERADSFCFNPHKWLLTNFDCDCFFVRDRRPLIEALSVTPSYLRNQASESGAVIDYRDWQIPLGRRFRALKLWFVIRAFGAEGLRAHVRRTIGLASRFEEHVRSDGRFEVVTRRTLNLVCFRLRETGDEAQRRLMDRINQGGSAFLSHAVVPLGEPRRPSFVLRVAVGAPLTRESDIDRLWRTISTHANEVLG